MPDSNLAPLDAAATALLAVGCAGPFGTNPEIRVHCLWLVEQLRVLGAFPERSLEPLAADEVGDTIRTALASLPSDFATHRALVDAISTLRAFQAVG